MQFENDYILFVLIFKASLYMIVLIYKDTDNINIISNYVKLFLMQ